MSPDCEHPKRRRRVHSKCLCDNALVCAQEEENKGGSKPSEAVHVLPRPSRARGYALAGPQSRPAFSRASVIRFPCVREETIGPAAGKRLLSPQPFATVSPDGYPPLPGECRHSQGWPNGAIGWGHADLSRRDHQAVALRQGRLRHPMVEGMDSFELHGLALRDLRRTAPPARSSARMSRSRSTPMTR